MSTEPYRTELVIEPIEFYRAESNDKYSITELDRTVIELYRKIFSSIKIWLLITVRLSSISVFAGQTVIACSTARLDCLNDLRHCSRKELFMWSEDDLWTKSVNRRHWTHTKLIELYRNLSVRWLLTFRFSNRPPIARNRPPWARLVR